MAPPFSNSIESRHDFPAYEGRVRAYIIASTPRSGSHLLGHALFGAGLFGYPLEYLKPQHWQDWSQRAGVPPNQQPSVLACLMQHRTSPNGLFGIKTHWPHFAGHGAASLIELLEAVTETEVAFIRLRREDVLSQAISWSLAAQTGQWFSGTPGRAEPLYSRSELQDLIAEIARQNREWDGFLQGLGAQPLDLEYDRDVRRDVGVAVSMVATHLGVECPGRIEPPDFAKQAGPINLAWRKRFLAESAVA